MRAPRNGRALPPNQRCPIKKLAKMRSRDSRAGLSNSVGHSPGTVNRGIPWRRASLRRSGSCVFWVMGGILVFGSEVVIEVPLGLDLFPQAKDVSRADAGIEIDVICLPLPEKA